jgi:hypothetical protein
LPLPATGRSWTPGPPPSKSPGPETRRLGGFVPLSPLAGRHDADDT